MTIEQRPGADSAAPIDEGLLSQPGLHVAAEWLVSHGEIIELTDDERWAGSTKVWGAAIVATHVKHRESLEDWQVPERIAEARITGLLMRDDGMRRAREAYRHETDGWIFEQVRGFARRTRQIREHLGAGEFDAAVRAEYGKMMQAVAGRRTPRPGPTTPARREPARQTGAGAPRGAESSESVPDIVRLAEMIVALAGLLRKQGTRPYGGNCNGDDGMTRLPGAEICRGCRLSTRCLAYGILATNEVGIFGGKEPDEIRRLRAGITDPSTGNVFVGARSTVERYMLSIATHPAAESE